MIFIIVLCLYNLGSVYAPVPVNQAGWSFTYKSQEEILFTRHRDRLIRAIIKVESNGNAYAYNKPEQAAGILQIRPVMLKHVNKLTGSKYTLSDRYDSTKSIAMFDSLMKYRNPTYNILLASNLWNRGTISYKRYTYTDKVLAKYE